MSTYSLHELRLHLWQNRGSSRNLLTNILIHYGSKWLRKPFIQVTLNLSFSFNFQDSVESPSDLFNWRLPSSGSHLAPRINVSKHRQNRTDLRPSFLRFLLLTFVPPRAIFLGRATNRTINLNMHKNARVENTAPRTNRIQKNTLSSSRFAKNKSIDSRTEFSVI